MSPYKIEMCVVDYMEDKEEEIIFDAIYGWDDGDLTV